MKKNSQLKFEVIGDMSLVILMHAISSSVIINEWTDCNILMSQKKIAKILYFQISAGCSTGLLCGLGNSAHALNTHTWRKIIKLTLRHKVFVFTIIYRLQRANTFNILKYTFVTLIYTFLLFANPLKQKEECIQTKRFKHTRAHTHMF